MGKSAPSPPNPYTTANAQTQSNIQTAQTQARLNDTNQVTPYGSLTYTPNANGGYTAASKLSAPEQQIFNTQVGNQQQYGQIASNQLGQVSSALSTPFSYAGMPAMGASTIQGGPIQQSLAGPSTYAPQAQQLQQSILQRLQPFEQQQTDTLSAQLRNQGLVPGSQAYNTAMLQNSQSNNNLALGAVSTADQEQQNLYNMGLQSGQFANAAQAQGFSQQAEAGQYADQQRQQAIQQAQLLRQEPLNETAALMTGSQVANPNWVNTPQTNVAGTDISGLINSNYQAQLQQYQNQQSGLFGLAGTLGGAALTGGIPVPGFVASAIGGVPA